MSFLIVNKPVGATSHDIVRKLKRILKPVRIGHLGTLDPFASGILPIMLDGTTRLADEAHEGTKAYEFVVGFGVETDTLDPSGNCTQYCEKPTSFDIAQFEKLLVEAANKFTGTILQTPPAYSALKYEGRPLYEYMRAEGKLPFDLAEKTREVEIFSLKLLNVSAVSAASINSMVEENHLESKIVDEKRTWAIARFEVKCGKGTYVRTLCKQIAEYLGYCGHCVELCRTEVAQWKLSDTTTFQWQQQLGHIDFYDKNLLPDVYTAAKEKIVSEYLRPSQDFAQHLPFLHLPSDFEISISNGNVFVAPQSSFCISSQANGNGNQYLANTHQKLSILEIFESLKSEGSLSVLLSCGSFLFLAKLEHLLDSSSQMLKVHPKKKLSL